MKTGQRGFTLVELVVVIVILGILAATAIPRYADYTRQSRIAAMNGLAGAVRSAVAVVQGRYISLGTGVSPVVMLDGTNVAVSTGVAGGIPTDAAGGIAAAVNTGGTFVYTPGGGTGTWNFATAVAACNVTYNDATGAATVNIGVPGAGC